MVLWIFFFKQKTTYEMRISDWSSYVCSTDLVAGKVARIFGTDEPWLLFQEVVELLLNALLLPQGILSLVNELAQGIDTVPLAAIILKSATLFDRGKFNELGCDDGEKSWIMHEPGEATQHFSSMNRSGNKRRARLESSSVRARKTVQERSDV